MSTFSLLKISTANARMFAGGVLGSHHSRGIRTRHFATEILAATGVHVVGEISVPATGKGTLVAVNHISFLDPFVIGSLLPEASYVVDYRLMAGFGNAMWGRSVDLIPFDKVRLRDLPRLVTEMAERLIANRTVVLFPSARAQPDQILKFSAAGFQAAIDSGSNVLPVALYTKSTAYKWMADERNSALSIVKHVACRNDNGISPVFVQAASVMAGSGTRQSLCRQAERAIGAILRSKTA